MLPTVSVHIVTYNSVGDPGMSDAVKQQTYGIQQAVIIDNASSDDTVACVTSFIEQVRNSSNSSSNLIILTI